MSIVLEPSDKPGALVPAIKRASQLNPLLLKRGVHLTSPGVRQQIEIGAEGLKIGVAPGPAFTPPPIIRRPDSSIDLETPDSNYGLYFVPAPPTRAEVQGAQWRTHTDEDGTTIQFDVVMRGSIDLTGLTVDCNMGNQGLEPLPKTAAEHSAMLAFAGKKYTVTGDDNVRRFIYVGFDRVSLKDMVFVNGGFADDVWFSRGYFHPNIEEIILQGVEGHLKDRVNHRRATVSFSEPSQSIQIENADIYRLHLEDTISTPWDQRPRKDPVFKPATFTLSGIKANIISLSANGHVFRVSGHHITVADVITIDGAADGTIVHSALRATNTQDRRLFRLQKMLFDNVTWRFLAEEGHIRGIRPTAKDGDPCFVEFRNNVFVVENRFSSGQLLDSEYSNKETRNHVLVVCRGCKYPDLFATKQFPDTHIALAKERGTWIFDKDDFGNRDLAHAVVKGPHDDVRVVFE